MENRNPDRWNLTGRYLHRLVSADYSYNGGSAISKFPPLGTKSETRDET